MSAITRRLLVRAFGLSAVGAAMPVASALTPTPSAVDPILEKITEYVRMWDFLRAAEVEDKDPIWSRWFALEREIYATSPTTMDGAMAKIELVKKVARESGCYFDQETICGIVDHLLPCSATA